jgi:putative ABC transport system permease protein
MFYASASFDQLLNLAVHNLLRAKARLAMTAGGVLVGTAAVTLLIALTIGLQTAAEAGIGQSSALTEIAVYPNYGFGGGGGGFGDGTVDTEVPQLTVEAVSAMWRIPGIQAVIPTASLRGGATLVVDDLWGGGWIIGVDPRLLPYMGLTMLQGEAILEEGDLLIGASLTENFFDPEATEFLPQVVDVMASEPEMILWSNNGEQREVDTRVRGVIAPGGSYDYAIIMPIAQAMEWNEWMTGQPFDPETFVFDQVTVRAASRETVNSVSDALKEMGFAVGGMGEYLNQINSFFVTMRVVLGGVGGVALLVAAFGVANTMTMAILERTREIGLMKAIGARDRDILTVFLCEAALVGLLGGAMGLGISYLLGSAINGAIASMPVDPNGGGGAIGFLGVNPAQLGAGLVLIPTELALFALGLAMSVGILAGLLPSLRAARMLTVQALRAE